MSQVKCGQTMTGTRTRYECFLRKLQGCGIVIYNILCSIFVHDTTSAEDLRMYISQRCKDIDAFGQFRQSIQTKCPDIHRTVRMTIEPYMHLMGLDHTYACERIQTHDACVHALWLFFTRILYERPILLQPDSVAGDHVSYIHDVFKWFISEQVEVGGGSKE